MQLIGAVCELWDGIEVSVLWDGIEVSVKVMQDMDGVPT